MKTKKIIAFSAMAILCLLFMNISSKANELTIVESAVDYPKSVRQGKTFEITITFIYPSKDHIIYGDRANIWLYTAINDNVLTIDTMKRAIDSDADLQPALITFTINTSVRNYAEGDIFKFRIKYKSGVTTCLLNDVCFDVFIEDVYTEVYEIKIKSASLINFSFASVLIPLMFVATLLSIKKIKTRSKLK